MIPRIISGDSPAMKIAARVLYAQLADTGCNRILRSFVNELHRGTSGIMIISERY